MDPLWRKCKFQEQSKCTKSLSLKWKVNMIRVERERGKKRWRRKMQRRGGSGGMEGGYRRGEKECFLSREWDLHISGRKCPIFKGHPSQPDKKCHLKLDGRGAKWINKYINKSTNKPSKLTEFQKTGVEEGQVLWGGRPTDIKLKKNSSFENSSHSVSEVARCRAEKPSPTTGTHWCCVCVCSGLLHLNTQLHASDQTVN